MYRNDFDFNCPHKYLYISQCTYYNWSVHSLVFSSSSSREYCTHTHMYIYMPSEQWRHQRQHPGTAPMHAGSAICSSIHSLRFSARNRAKREIQRTSRICMVYRLEFEDMPCVQVFVKFAYMYLPVANGLCIYIYIYFDMYRQIMAGIQSGNRKRLAMSMVMAFTFVHPRMLTFKLELFWI